MTAKVMTLRQALLSQDDTSGFGRSVNIVAARRALNNMPVGGWAETRQARADILAMLPARADRGFTLDSFIDAAYAHGGAGRYRSRTPDEIMEVIG